ACRDNKNSGRPAASYSVHIHKNLPRSPAAGLHAPGSVRRARADKPSEFFLEHADAVGADVPAAEGDNVLGAVAEDAGRLVLAKDHRIALYVDLHRIFLVDIERPSELYGQHYAPQLIDLSYDPG